MPTKDPSSNWYTIDSDDLYVASQLSGSTITLGAVSDESLDLSYLVGTLVSVTTATITTTATNTITAISPTNLVPVTEIVAPPVTHPVIVNIPSPLTIVPNDVSANDFDGDGHAD